MRAAIEAASMPRRKRAFSAIRLFFVLLAGLLVMPAHAQAPAPPQGMTPEQFNAIVDATSQAVLGKISRSQAIPPATSAEGADDLESRVAAFVNAATSALAATPGFFVQIARVPSLLNESGAGGRGLAAYLILLVLTVGAALCVEWLLRRGSAAFRRRLGEQAEQRPGLSAFLPLILLAALDMIGVGAVWLVSYGAVGVWFQGDDGQARLARLILTGVFAWRLYMLAFRVAIRPEQSSVRLASMSDEAARQVYGRVSAVVALAVALRSVMIVLAAIGATREEITAGRILGNLLLLSVLLWAAYSSRDSIAQWFAGFGRAQKPHSLAQFLSARWLYIATPFFGVLCLTQIYGAIAHRPTIPSAIILTMNLIVGLIFFETLRAYLTRPRNSPAQSEVAAATLTEPRARLLSSLVLRCARAAVLILIAAAVVQTWIVDVFGLIDAGAWRAATHASVTTGVTLFCAYVAWELVRYVTDSYVAPRAAVGGLADEDAPPPASASRLATLAPLLRVAASIGIAVLALLVILTELGVNITPLIAGASVVGLAVSFGSQTLVRDIVSGMFYLADDAFRVGEYIDCGKAKGTVEGFTLRSIKLRHQNGQVHTIPFGQLGQITNFSRDWATVKFNLRLARDVDLEKARKAIKRVGQAMLEDPEIKDDFLSPVKLQGVADILDNALVVRVKFTVKPVNPSYIQRIAVKKIVEAFAENGIEFASATVAVQTIGDANAAGAAAIAARNRTQEQAIAAVSG